MSANARAFTEPVGTTTPIIEDDRRLVRYAFMAGPDIDLSRNSGSLFIGDFKDEILPARTLVKLPRATSFGPFEVPATIMHGDSIVQQGPSFTAGMEGMIPPPTTATPDILRGAKERLTRFTNEPKLCAYILMRANEARGMCLLEHVKGQESEEVLRIYSLFMPIRPNGALDTQLINDLGWDMEREALGVRVRGPFLDDIREYLREGGAAGQRLTEAAQPGRRNATAEQIKAAKAMLLQMRAACERAWAFFNNHLNIEEAAIIERRNGRPGKRAYDLPDGRFTGGTLPMDIQALANTKRDPMDMKATREQTRQMEDNNAVMLKGFEMVADKIAAAQPKAVTAEDVAQLVDAKMQERDEYWTREIEKMKKSPTGDTA
jgi:hypothetical protein